VKNSRDEQYELVLDHDNTLTEPDIETRLLCGGTDESREISVKLADGVRYSISIGGKAELIVKVIEQRIDQSRMELITTTKQHENLQIDWLEQSVVAKNGPLAQDEGIRACLKLHQEHEAKREEISDAVKESERLAQRQDRLRKNLKTGGQDDLANRWRTELDEAEQAIRRIEEEQIPVLRAEERASRSKVRDALKALSAEWSEEASGE
jgi:hypothetical protein